MLQLLKIEWLKIKNYVIFWIILGIILLLFISLTIGISSSNIKIALFYGAGFEIKNYFQFPYIWSTLSWIAGWYSHLWALLIIILIGNEFNYKMMRQQVLTGTKRKDIFISKILLILALPLVMFLIIILFSVFFGYSNTEAIDGSIFKGSYFVFNYYIQIIAYLSFASMIIILIRSIGLSIIVYIGYFIFEGILRFLVKLKFKEAVYYFPIKSINSLTPRPSIDTAMNETMKQSFNLNDITMHFSELTTLLIPTVYLLIFTGISYWVIKKRDL